MPHSRVLKWSYHAGFKRAQKRQNSCHYCFGHRRTFGVAARFWRYFQNCGVDFDGFCRQKRGCCIPKSYAFQILPLHVFVRHCLCIFWFFYSLDAYSFHYAHFGIYHWFCLFRLPLLQRNAQHQRHCPFLLCLHLHGNQLCLVAFMAWFYRLDFQLGRLYFGTHRVDKFIANKN